MRIALVHFLQDENAKHKEIVKKLEQTASAQGHKIGRASCRERV